MLSSNLTQAFPNSSANARKTFPKPKTKPSFVIVKIHHSITVDDVKDNHLNYNAGNFTKSSQINSLATGQPPKLKLVITDTIHYFIAAQKHGQNRLVATAI